MQRLEVSRDYGESWQEADLDDPVNDGAWQNLRRQVTVPQSGFYEIRARATDTESVM